MTVIDLSVVGLGLVSPTALSPRQHVFFIAAESTLGTARAFVDGAGQRLGAIHCPWLDPGLPLGARVTELGRRALGTALEPAIASPELARCRLPAMLCCAAPSVAFAAEDAAGCEQAWAQRYPLDFGARLHGEAGLFHGLATAAHWLSSGAVPAVVLVAVDSHCSVAALGARPLGARRWERVPAYLSEAAAALVVVSPGREGGLPSLGRISFASVRPASASDDNDEIVDGTSMTQLLAQAAGEGLKITQAFGQHNVDRLRHLSWTFSVSRNCRAFDPLCRFVCVEDAIGRVGAAAGAAHLVYGLATELHGTASYGGGGTLAAWAVSRDGTCGLAIARGANGGQGAKGGPGVEEHTGAKGVAGAP